MAASDQDWRSEAFRSKVVSQIEEAVRVSISSGNSAMLAKNPSDMETHVFMKAKSREEYLTLVARLLVYIRDIQNVNRLRPQLTGVPSVDQSAAGPQTMQRVKPLQQQKWQISGGQTQFASVRGQLTPHQQGGLPSQGGPVMGQYPMAATQPIQNRPQMTPQAPGHQLPIGHPQQQVSMQQVLQMQQQIIYSKASQQQQQLYMAQQQQQAALKTHVQHVQTPQQNLVQQPVSTYTTSVSAPQSQVYSPHQQPHPSPQTPSQMPSPRPAAQQHPVATPVSHVGRSLHALSPVQVSQLQGRPPPTPKPQPSPASQNVITPSPVAHAPSPAQPGQPYAAPSPSPQVAASPAAPQSVPTPGTCGSVQSPASVYNPGSVGPSVASPAPMNPADEQAYLEKLKQLSVYISPLQKMVNKMAKEEHSKSEQYKKLTSLLDILTNPSKRVTMGTLVRVESVLKKVIHTPPSSTSTTEPQPVTVYTQALCQPLLDVVSRHMKSPLLAHTLQRTFGPVLHAVEGPPICPPLPPSKRIRLQENEKKSPLPHALQGEIARLSRRFSVWPSPTPSTKHSCSLLKCSLSDINLPTVPPIEISVPRNYPYASPECLTGDYASTPFLQRIQMKLSTKLLHMPERYSVTALLDAWETSIRQTCNAEVASVT